MTKNFYCHCSTGCHTLHCQCFKRGQPCDEACDCKNCNNPLNQHISKCAVYQLEEYKQLPEEKLQVILELPCGCEQVPLYYLLAAYHCQHCHKSYWYSFCYNEVVEEGSTWECEICGNCY